MFGIALTIRSHESPSLFEREGDLGGELFQRWDLVSDTFQLPLTKGERRLPPV